MLVHTEPHQRTACGSAAEALRREALILGRARHPGIAELLSCEDDGETVRLTLARPDGPALADCRLERAEIAGIMAVLATTVSDLHAIGVACGALDAADVVIGPDGRPVLGSLGRATILDGPARSWAVAPIAQADVGSLCQLLAQLLERGGDHSPASSPLQQLAASWADEGADGHRRLRPRRPPGRPPTAQAFADRVVALVPDARLPARESSDEDQDARIDAWLEQSRDHCDLVIPESGPPRLPVVLLAVLGLLLVGVLVVRHGGSRPHLGAAASRQAPPTGGSSPPPTTGPAPAAPSPMSFAGGVLTVGTDRYNLGLPGDVIATGRWNCQPTATVALLRPSLGSVWVFDAWPTESASTTSRFVTQVDGATALQPQADGACDDLLVERSNGQPLLVRTRTS